MSESFETAQAARDLPKPREPAAVLGPERWLEEFGDELFAFACARVRDWSTAQDLVQEAFLAALRSYKSFSGRSSERAWLFGILRNKLADYHRARSREAAYAEPESALPEEEKFFRVRGPRKDAWLKSLAPRPWTAPDEALSKKEFHEVFQSCLDKLPPKVARAFWLREVEGLSSEEVCKDLDLTSNNFWVMAHRARLALRRCLELNWFDRKKD